MYLHEEILLLALKEDSGKLSWKAGMVQYVLAGAMFAELLLEERISLSQDKKQRVHVDKPGHHENHALNEALEMMSKAKKEQPIKHWVTKFASMKKLKDKSAANLCQQGILNRKESKVLLFFTWNNYPIGRSGRAVKDRLVAKLREAIFADSEVDMRTALLVSLAHKPGLLNIPFSGKELRQRKARLKALTNGDLIGAATNAAIQDVQAAMTMIAVMPVITGGSGG